MNRVHKLSPEEIKALKQLHRETDEANVRSRCDMILWFNEGLSPAQIAQRVRFSRRTVTRHIKRYEVEGLAGLLTRSRSGRPRCVTAEYEAKLLEVVAQAPRSLGLPFSNWTTAKLAEGDQHLAPAGRELSQGQQLAATTTCTYSQAQTRYCSG